jgi:hypothetical protein
LLALLLSSALPVGKATAAGALTPFKSIEAESGTIGAGAAVQALTAAPKTFDSSPELEASGHAYVQLKATGQYVFFKNLTGGNISALNLRYSIPDAPKGGGITATLNLYINGVFRQAVSLNSIQSWCYNPPKSRHGWSQDPSTGKPHIFFDEAHFFIKPPAVPPGATIAFRKDAANTASFYWLDVVDMENPPPPATQTPGSLSITDFGATADKPDFDSQPAIQKCIKAAQQQKKAVWVPRGTFYLRDPKSQTLEATGITIEGAGMWYSVLSASPEPPAEPHGNILKPTSCTVRNLAFDSNAVHEGNGGLNVKGSNWLVEKIWVQHMGAGIWADGDNGTIRDCRTGSTWADGININNGNGGTGNNTGNNLTVTNCFVRGSGDDGIAINSSKDPGCVQMDHPAVTNCTSVAAWWANNIGIYGGTNINVSGNLATDSVGAFGISLGQFGQAGAPLQSGSVTNNVVLRGGSFGFYGQGGVPAMNVGTTAAVSNLNVQGNVISKAMFVGIGLQLCGENVIVQGNTVDAPGTTGIRVSPKAVGSATIKDNAVTNLSSGQSAFLNDAPKAFTATLIGNKWLSGKR